MEVSGQLQVLKDLPPVPTEWEDLWAPQTVLKFWKRETYLAATENRNIIPWSSSSYRSHYHDYAVPATGFLLAYQLHT